MNVQKIGDVVAEMREYAGGRWADRWPDRAAHSKESHMGMKFTDWLEELPEEEQRSIKQAGNQLLEQMTLSALREAWEAFAPDTSPYQPLTDQECDEFRRTPGDFNTMLRKTHEHGYRGGCWATAGRIKAHPPAQPASVPDERPVPASTAAMSQYNNGWNACRAAMLKGGA
jgi:hypothetical protein